MKEKMQKMINTKTKARKLEVDLTLVGMKLTDFILHLLVLRYVEG
jgi:hypothetical protein